MYECQVHRTRDVQQDEPPTGSDSTLGPRFRPAPPSRQVVQPCCLCLCLAVLSVSLERGGRREHTHTHTHINTHTHTHARTHAHTSIYRHTHTQHKHHTHVTRTNKPTLEGTRTTHAPTRYPYTYPHTYTHNTYTQTQTHNHAYADIDTFARGHNRAISAQCRDTRLPRSSAHQPPRSKPHSSPPRPHQ